MDATRADEKNVTENSPAMSTDFIQLGYLPGGGPTGLHQLFLDVLVWKVEI